MYVHIILITFTNYKPVLNTNINIKFYQNYGQIYFLFLFNRLKIVHKIIRETEKSLTDEFWNIYTLTFRDYFFVSN